MLVGELILNMTFKAYKKKMDILGTANVADAKILKILPKNMLIISTEY